MENAKNSKESTIFSFQERFFPLLIKVAPLLKTSTYRFGSPNLS